MPTKWRLSEYGRKTVKHLERGRDTAASATLFAGGRHGYIIMEDCGEGGERYNIYYDGNTRRSDTFEQIANERGFTIKEWSE